MNPLFSSVLAGALLLVSLSACSNEGGDAPSSPSPAAVAASPTSAGSTAAPPAGALPNLSEGMTAHEAITALQAAGYVLALGITELDRGPENGAYLEAGDPKAEPKAVFLHIKVVQGKFELKSVENNPAEALWRKLLPFGPNGFDESNNSAQMQAKNFTEEEKSIELMPLGPDGQTWEAEGGWRLVLAPGDSAELVGPKGGGKLDLHGRWGNEGVVQTVRVSPGGDHLAIVERLPHTKLLACHVLALNAESKSFGPASMEGPL